MTSTCKLKSSIVKFISEIYLLSCRTLTSSRSVKLPKVLNSLFKIQYKI